MTARYVEHGFYLDMFARGHAYLLSANLPRVHSQIDLALNIGGSGAYGYGRSSKPPKIYIYLNSGSGIDLSTHSAQVPGNDKGHRATRAFYAAADVDMDGHLDLIVPMIETCFGDGSGTTFVCSDVPMDTRMSSGISAFSVGDFDGESYPSYYSTDNSVVGDHHYAKGRAAPGRLQ